MHSAVRNRARTAVPGTPKSWVKLRHRVVYTALRRFFQFFLFLSYGYKAVRFTAEERGVPYLILSNHVGPMDPFMISVCFRRPIYYVASDHLFRLGWVSAVIRWMVAPIPIVKSRLDMQAIKDMYRITSEGGSIGLFPSGNRTFTGPEMPFPASTAKLVRRMGVPVALFRLDGGYLTTPRWSRRHRRGHMRGQVVRILEPEELSRMSDAQISSCIWENLQTADVYLKAHPAYHGSRLAEYLERVLFLCPACLATGTLTSHGDRLSCTCGWAVRYRPDGKLVPDGDRAESGYPDVNTLDVFQREQLIRMLENPKPDQPIFRDTGIRLSQTERAHSTRGLCACVMELYPDRLVFSENDSDAHVFPLQNLGELIVHGPQTLQFTERTKNTVYEVRADHPYSAYKYTLAVQALRNRHAHASDKQE